MRNVLGREWFYDMSSVALNAISSMADPIASRDKTIDRLRASRRVLQEIYEHMRKASIGHVTYSPQVRVQTSLFKVCQQENLLLPTVGSSKFTRLPDGLSFARLLC